MQEILQLPLDLIDPPSYAVRQAIDDSGIMELAEDIRRVGLINPLRVVKVGDRYEINSGHRRYLALKYLDRSNANCILVDCDDDQQDLMKLYENYSREDVIPLDEASFFSQLMIRRGWTGQQLALYVGRSVSYVQSRLQLLDLDPRIMDALRTNIISMSVALVLHRCPNYAYLTYFLNLAVDQGANVRTVANWMLACPVQAPENPARPGDSVGDLPLRVDAVKPILRCRICNQDHDPNKCLMVAVCAECFQAIQQPVTA